MGLLEYARAVRDRWLAVAVCAAVALGIAAGAALLTTPKYSATTTVYLTYPQLDKVIEQDAGKTLASDQVMLLSFRRLKSYAKSAESTTISRQAVKTQKLSLSPEEAAARIDGIAVSGSSLVRIVATDADPELAAKLSGATAVHLAAYIERVERPQNGEPSPVRASVTEEPRISDHPVQPDVPTMLGVALLVGTSVGIAVAIVRQTLDRSITSVEVLAEITGAPTLGTIGDDPELAAHPVAAQLDPGSPLTLAFQQLRTSLQFVDRGRHPSRLLVTSPGVADGTTTTAANLAVALAKAGRSVVLVECDLARQRLAELFGLAADDAGLTTVLSGRVDPEDALQPVEGLPLEVLVGGPDLPNALDLIRSRTMELLLRELDRRADVIILDGPPLLGGAEGALLAHDCDGAMLVVRHGRTTRPQVEQAMAAMAETNARVLGTVLTMVPSANSAPTRRLRLPGVRSGRPDAAPLDHEPLDAAPSGPVGPGGPVPLGAPPDRVAVAEAVLSGGPGGPDAPRADGPSGPDPYGADPYGPDPYESSPYGADPYEDQRVEQGSFDQSPFDRGPFAGTAPSDPSGSDTEPYGPGPDRADPSPEFTAQVFPGRRAPTPPGPPPHDRPLPPSPAPSPGPGSPPPGSPAPASSAPSRRAPAAERPAEQPPPRPYAGRRRGKPRPELERPDVPMSHRGSHRSSSG